VVVSLPATSRILVLTMIFLYVFGVVTGLGEVLALVPSNFLPPRFWIWSIFTSGIFHMPSDYFELILNILVTIFVGGRILEPFWGRREYIKFILFVLLTSGFGAFTIRLAAFLITFNYAYLFSPIGGFFGGSVGFLVALKQLAPDREWAIYGISIRAKHLPLIFLLSSLSMEMIFFDSGSFSFGFVGFISSWIYLRWIQERPGSVTGDFSEDFKFSSFFPEQIQPLIDRIGRLCSCCLPKTPSSASSRNSEILASSVPFNSVLDSPEDAERRRRIAIKALDETLAKKVFTSPINTSTTAST